MIRISKKLLDLITYAYASFITDLQKELYKTAFFVELVKPLTSSEENKEAKEMEEIVAKALMLPLPIKNAKIEGNKLIIEFGEGEEGEQQQQKA